MVATASPKCLELNRISKSFGRHEVLKDIDLTVAEQEIVGVVGPNGAGKTTLFDIIGGQVKPSAGTVRYREHDITHWPVHRVCHAGIGRTFQIAKCFPEMTAWENVLMALWFGKSLALPASEGRAKAVELLRIVDLEEKAERRAQELTLSELRRLEVARALGTRPQLLLLDEIAAGLSPQAVKQAVELVETLRKQGLTVIITDHFLNFTVKVSDRLIAIDQGEIIAEGSPYQVMHDPDVVSAYLGERHREGEED